LHGDVAYFTTQYVDGTTLADLVSDGRFSDGREATRESCIRLLIEVCQVLQHVHDQGFLHLDLHPRCIRVDAGGRLKLLDVGVASMLHPKPAPEQPVTMAMPSSARWRSKERTATWAQSEPVGTVMFQPPPIGTAAIMPPEQWQRRGTATVQIDIYNLGCTLYYVLTGELPFGGDGTLDLMQQHLSVDPLKSKRAKHISKPYKEILRRALAKVPTDRYASVAELGEALDACSSKKADSGFTSWARCVLTKLTGR
jgi:serine/threonine-protein kinase